MVLKVLLVLLDLLHQPVLEVHQILYLLGHHEVLVVHLGLLVRLDQKVLILP